MKGCFVVSPLWEQKEKERTVKYDVLEEGTFGGDALLNAELVEGQGVRTHRPLVAADLPAFPENLRAVQSYGDTVFLFCQEMAGGHYETYTLKNGTLKKVSTTAATFPFNSDGSDYCNSMVATLDEDAGIDQGCGHTKLLLFPSKQVICINSTDSTVSFGAMDSDVPAFRHATACNGRLYGSVGNKLYVSGESGCFDWFFDESGLLLSSAWKGGSTTVSEGGLPITALCSYKDEVLIFRENAMQTITGDGAPFAVKDLFKVGTHNSRSVKECRGLLYFVSGNRVACYNGSSVRFLPDLPEGTVLPGAAGVFEGKYYFYAERAGRRYLYSYHPGLKGYGVLEIEKQIKEFVHCGDTLYLFSSEDPDKKYFYLFGEQRTDTLMTCRFPLFPREPIDFFIDQIALRAKPQERLTIDLDVELTDSKGVTVASSYGVLIGKEGDKLFRLNRRTATGHSAEIVVRCRGDVLLEDCFVRYKEKKWRKRIF
jgi:hypothetical protein